MALLNSMLDPSYSEQYAPAPVKPVSWNDLFKGGQNGPVAVSQETPEAPPAQPEEKKESLQSVVHNLALRDLIQGVASGSSAGGMQAQPEMPQQPFALAPAQPYGQSQPQFTGTTLPAAQPQPTPSQAAAPVAQPAAPAGPSVMDRLAGLSEGYNSGGLVGGIAKAFGGQQPITVEQQNQTYQALISKHVPPEVAKAAVLNPAILQQVLPLAFPPKAPAVEKLKEDERLIQNNIGPDGVARPIDITPGGNEMMQGKTVQGRLNLAPRFNLKPGTPEYNGYILNDKFPDVTPDHKAIGEADAQVLSSRHLIEDLSKALQLSSQAYSGVGAETRGYVVSQLPGNHPDAQATNEYANLINSSILPSLKSTFPGRVTNADLELMKELQGSASHAQPVRESIVKRGIARAQEILAEKQSQSEALRNGSYYRPGGNPTPGAQPGVQPQFQEGQTATGPGGQRIVFHNGQWMTHE